MLVVPNAVGRSIDNLVVAAFGLQRFDAAEDRFGFHHHAGFAAERVIVHLTVFVECIVPDVMDMDFDQSFCCARFRIDSFSGLCNSSGTTVRISMRMARSAFDTARSSTRV